MVDLLRQNVLAPRRLVDLTGIEELTGFSTSGSTLRFGALARMADLAEDPVLKRDYPALAESLQQAASQQIRNMATLGGNILQRTRCGYFRDAVSPCNRRRPGSGCAAIEGYNRDQAVLGASATCVATYPGDFGVALAAFGAEVELASPTGCRTLSFANLHRLPGDRPDIETVLRPGELVTAITLPATPLGRNSTYVKIRDRWSYAFAVASAAVALRLEEGRVADARIALGGVATKPWRSEVAERMLIGAVPNEAAARRAGDAAFVEARALSGNASKLELGPRAVAQAIMIASRRS
jgi:xanthine dehydrogenase YagS FAD-binding subunit